MKTGDNTPILGLYTSYCCDYELILDPDQPFPRCLNCQQLCGWRLVEEVFEALPAAA